jgi:hypothetical protein
MQLVALAFVSGAICGAVAVYYIATSPAPATSRVMSQDWLRSNLYDRSKQETIWH